MNNFEIQKLITNLHREYAYLIQEYADATKRDDIFKVKRKLLERMRIIEKEIKRLEDTQKVSQVR